MSLVIPAVVGENPFPGLRPFEAEQTHMFFGRDGQSDQLVRRLARFRFLAIVGTSGSGKSSLVRAGLLPALRGGYLSEAGSRWRIAICRPGADPIHNLALALRTRDALGGDDVEPVLRSSSVGLVDVARSGRMHADDNLVIVVDQFEEIFRFPLSGGRAADEPTAFVKLLLEAARQTGAPVYVALTMRSEFLGRCAQFRDLPEALNEGQYLIPRMTRDERREAIEGPVAVGGATITPRLVQRLLNDVGDDEYQLPVLQHALMRTWDRWRADNQPLDPIDLDHYEAAGGMAGALSLHANDAYAELPDERSRDLARRLFQCLTEKRPDSPETRRPTTLGRLCDVTGADERAVVGVLDVFRASGRAFLMPAAPEPVSRDTMVDITHESLIRLWNRLQAWVDEEAESARWYRRLAADAQAFGRREQSLWVDPQLQLAVDWSQKTPWTGAWAESYDKDFAGTMRFLDASRRGRQKRRVWQAVFGVVVLLAVAVAMLLMESEGDRRRTNDQNQQLSSANTSLENANVTLSQQKQQLASQAEQLKTQAQELDDKNNQLAASLAQLVLRAREELTANVARRLSTLALLVNSQKTDPEVAGLLAIESLQRLPSPDQAQIVKQLLHTTLTTLFPSRGRATTTLAFSPDLRYLAAGGEGTALYDVATRQPIWTDSDSDAIRAMAFRPDGKTLVIGGDSGIVRELDAATGREVSREKHFGSVVALAFSPDGRLRFTASDIGGLRVVDTSSGRLLWERAGDFRAAAMSPDGLLVSAGGAGGLSAVVVLDASTGKPVQELRSPGRASAIAFRPDSKILAVATEDRQVIYYDLENGVAIGAPMKYASDVSGVAFSADSRYMFTRESDKIHVLQLLQWNLRELSQIAQNSTITAFAITRDDRIATGGDDAYVRIRGLNADRRELWGPPTDYMYDGIYDMAFTPDGRRLAAGFFNSNIVRVFDTANGREVWRTGRIGPVRAVAISPSGTAVATDTGFIAADRGEPVRLPSRAQSLTFSADGRTIIFGDGRVFDAVTGREVRQAVRPVGETRVLSDDGRYAVTVDERVIDLSSRAEILRLPPGRTSRSLALSADGRYVAIGDNGIRLYDRASRKEILWLARGELRVLALTFSADGHRLFAASALDGSRAFLSEHLLRPEDLIAEACSRLTRNLTESEWREYIDDAPRKTCPSLPEPKRDRAAGSRF